MIGTNLVSHWYDDLTTEDLVLLLPAAKECIQDAFDPIEQEMWKVRVARMEEELLRRQGLQDELEV